jgi:hypothetical protein
MPRHLPGRFCTVRYGRRPIICWVQHAKPARHRHWGQRPRRCCITFLSRTPMAALGSVRTVRNRTACSRINNGSAAPAPCVGIQTCIYVLQQLPNNLNLHYHTVIIPIQFQYSSAPNTTGSISYVTTTRHRTIKVSLPTVPEAY